MADAEFASTEKYAADAEHEQNTTQATSSSQTQPATTYQKCYAKTPNTYKNNKRCFFFFSFYYFVWFCHQFLFFSLFGA